MTPDALANVIQIIATLIALVGLAVSFEFSRRGQKLQQEAAKASAEQAAESNRAAQAAAQRAAAAAALTIDDLARIAGALERLAERPSSTGGGFESRAAEAPASASWRLESAGGHGYRLSNIGSASALAVWIGGATSLDGPTAITGGPDLSPGAALTFEAAVLPTTADSTITITWANEKGGDRHSWRYPLPSAT